MKKQICLFVVVVSCCLSQLLPAVTVSNSNYQVETYISYGTSTIGRAWDFTFDSSGNIYVSHTFNDLPRNGSVRKIDVNKDVTVLRNDLVSPQNIIWGGGTAFGDYLYVADKFERTTFSKGEITKLDLAGNKSAFAGSGLSQPVALEIDRTGNYNSRLYIASGADDHISVVGSSGGSTTTFSNYPYHASGTIYDIAFDTTGNYQGSMFTGARLTNLQYAGLFHIDINGNESRYTDFEQATCIAFDDTTEQYFNGKMFAAGRDDADDLWTLYQVNGYYDTEVFASFDVTPGWAAPAIQFGADGAMYVMEHDFTNSEMIISRITPIPEPTTMLLMFVGCFMLKKSNRLGN